MSETKIEPAFEGEWFVARDGTRLALARWETENPKAVLVALHGMSDYSNAFALPAPWWAARGITVYAYDQRGFGRSPHRGLWAGGDAMRADFADAVSIVRARHPGVPVHALGLSMGGAVVMSALASESAPRVNGAILVAPAVWGWRELPLSYRAALWVGAHAAPWMELSGRGLKITPSDNIEMLRAIARDPLFIKRTRTDAVYGLVTLMDEAYAAASRIASPPILYLYGEKDEIIPKGPTAEAMATLGKKACVKRYPDGYHMLLRDLAGPERWKDIADWIADDSKSCRD